MRIFLITKISIKYIYIFFLQIYFSVYKNSIYKIYTVEKENENLKGKKYFNYYKIVILFPRYIFIYNAKKN